MTTPDVIRQAPQLSRDALRISGVLEHFAITVTRDELQRLVDLGDAELVADLVEQFSVLAANFSVASIEREFFRVAQRRLNQRRRP